MAVISPELLGSVGSLRGALRAWPSAFDLEEIQRGGCREFWEKAGVSPGDVLPDGGRLADWSRFWDETCPAGCVMYFSPGAKRDEERDSEGGEWGPLSFDDPGDACAEVFRMVVAGNLPSEDPDFALGTRSGVILYWRLKPADR